ncbi:hypothetical protein ACK30C_14315 [Aeromonas caviae]
MIIKKIKELHFHKREGFDDVIIPVPDSYTQTLVRRTKFNYQNEDYIVCLISTSRDFKESEIIEVRNDESHTAGFIIPGQALLSQECPNNTAPVYAAYSLYVASKICYESYHNKYNLVQSIAPHSANVKDQIFFEDIAYLILWKKKVNAKSIGEVIDKYYLSFLKNALYLDKRNVAKYSLLSVDDCIDFQKDKYIKIKENSSLPEHIKIITTELIPFTENVFLRFFYIYQLIEYLMGVDFKDRYDAIKKRLDTEGNITPTNLKDYLSKFGDIVKELPKIKSVFQKSCLITEGIADKTLSGITDEDFDGLGEKIYKIRNVIFHDYKSLHEKEGLINQLCYALMSYLLKSTALNS